MLNRLIDYTRAHIPESEPGFTVRDIRWRIELTKDGRLAGVLPMGDEDSGDERWCCPEMHDMQSGGKAHFLIDNLKTALMFKAAASDKSRHEFYVARIRDAAMEAPTLTTLARFLEDDTALGTLRQTLLAPPHRAKPTDNLEWLIDGWNPLKDSAVLDWWRCWRECGRITDDNVMVCFASGVTAAPAITHPKVMRLPGGQGSGDALIGFDKASFTSLRLKKSSNAAVSERAARSYVDALNHLVRHSSRRLGESLMLHWFKGTVPDKDDVLHWLQDPPGVAAASAAIAARKLFEAIRTGLRPDLSSNEFYALSVSGMSGRVMVRDWTEGRFEDLVSHVEAWFSDLAIVARDGHGHAHDPKFMAVCGALVRDLKDLPAPTAATLWKVAVQGLPIPQPLMAQALARFRADLVDKDQPAFNHARMGLIKAYFVRRKPGGDPTMTASYNPNHPAPAYHCGGLLAVLANLQRAALGDVGAGVVQRFYAAASQTPGLVLGRLAANARNHLAKLEPGLAWWYEERIAEIMSRLGDAAPRILDLEGQGLFALGYYQKLADLRPDKKTTVTAYVINEQGAQP
ncbi:MAG: type I-C CRISPR-associated protein Cas8c/Csd1 [Pseudomonadota bacterium]|nr:type I-C CRISPR-associated protein Cas8c/Csd1 [Pseudomonadota bacterium]